MADKKDTSKHANKASWGKGRSGNPGGRSPRIGPNGETAAQLARTHTAAAIDTLAEVNGNKKAPPIARVAAANALLDRGWGRPKEAEDNEKPDMTKLLSDLIAKLPG
jgi:hypothetical protein